MTMEKEMNLRVKNLGAWCLLIFAAPLLIGVAWIDEAAAQKVRVAMPAKSMTFLNFYVGDKFGIYPRTPEKAMMTLRFLTPWRSAQAAAVDNPSGTRFTPASPPSPP